MSELRYCPIKNSECSIEMDISASPLCFIAIPFREEMEDTRATVTKVLKRHGIQPYIADEEVTTARDILCKICEKITFSDFGIIELTSINPNVMLEFGIILGRRKPVFILFNKKAKPESNAEKIPADIVALERIEYSSQKALHDKFNKGIEQYIGKLDRKRKETDAMMQLALASARDKEFSTTDKLLEIIFERMEVSKGKDGKFSDLLKDVSIAVDPTETIRYSFALAKAYWWRGEIDKAVETAKDALQQQTIVFRKALETQKSEVDLDTIERLASDRTLARDPFFAAYKAARNKGGPSSVQDAATLLLQVLFKAKSPEKIIGALISKIKDSFFRKEPRVMPRFRSSMWESNVIEFYYISILMAYVEEAPDEQTRAKKIAEGFLEVIDKTLKEYYGSLLSEKL